MKINGKHYTSIWDDGKTQARVYIIDQRPLPHRFETEELDSLETCAKAIREMHLRGAPLIGVAAAYGMYLAAREAPVKSWRKHQQQAARQLLNTRPTAVDLAKAIERQKQVLNRVKNFAELAPAHLAKAREIRQQSIEQCRRIGEHGLSLLQKLSSKKKGETLNILTHCNAGWLACVDHGTALAPIYAAFNQGMNLHVWVDETRPRNQGARLTAFELGQHGIPHTIIADNAGGHLMQHGMVDLVLVGSDRTTRSGDVANKIGTYLKALAAHDNNIPFYVALPASSIDFNITDGFHQIPIEERSESEIHFLSGKNPHNDQLQSIRLTPNFSPASNFAFDLTPARLVTGLITERGICQASEKGLRKLFPENTPKIEKGKT